jgi:hypothetical protein
VATPVGVPIIFHNGHESALARTRSVRTTAIRTTIGRSEGVWDRQRGNACLLRTAAKVRCVVYTARPFVHGDLRERTEGTCPRYLPVHALRSSQSLRGFVHLDPAIERADFVEIVGTVSAAAVTHAGREEEPDVVSRSGRYTAK